MYLKISYAWGTLTLKDKIDRESDDPFNSEKTLEKLYMYESPFQNYIFLRTESDFTNDDESRKTEFEHLIDHTIRLKDTTSCIVVDTTNAIASAPCFEDIDRWIYNEGTNQIISNKHMQCITAKQVPLANTFYLDLRQCEDNNKLQKWIFQTDNKNPDIIENNPEISIHDMEEWQFEESNALTTTINSPIFGGLLHVNQGKGNIVWDLINWGLLRTKDQTKTKCVTYHGVGEVLTLETCDPNWTQCQGDLEKHLTSIDPLINTQTSVANCSGEAKVRQALEYASDFTIRPFNTNFCVKANSTMLVLEDCAETSTIWGTFNHTGQLMATDRSGLKSKAITVNVYREADVPLKRWKLKPGAYPKTDKGNITLFFHLIIIQLRKTSFFIALGRSKEYQSVQKPYVEGKNYQAGISSPNTLSLNNGFPTVEDIGPEENQAWEHVETNSRRSANVGFLAKEDVHLPQDPRTLIVYGNLVNRPPGWKWIEENFLCAKIIQLGSKVVFLKSIQINGNCARYYVKNNEIFHKS